MLERLKKELGLTSLTPAERRAEVKKFKEQSERYWIITENFYIFWIILSMIILLLFPLSAFLCLLGALPLVVVKMLLFVAIIDGTLSMLGSFLLASDLYFSIHVKSKFFEKENALPWVNLFSVGFLLGLVSLVSFGGLLVFALFPPSIFPFLATATPWLVVMCSACASTALMGVGALGFYLSPKALSGNKLGAEESQTSLPPYSPQHSQGEHLGVSSLPLPSPLNPETESFASSTENSELREAYTT